MPGTIPKTIQASETGLDGLFKKKKERHKVGGGFGQEVEGETE